jgi:hypothetical protein
MSKTLSTAPPAYSEAELERVLGRLDNTILPRIRRRLRTIEKSVGAIMTVTKKYSAEERLVEHIYSEWLAFKMVINPINIARSILRADPDIEKYGFKPDMIPCWEWREMTPCEPIGVVIIKETGSPALVYHFYPFTFYTVKVN